MNNRKQDNYRIEDSVLYQSIDPSFIFKTSSSIIFLIKNIDGSDNINIDYINKFSINLNYRLDQVGRMNLSLKNIFFRNNMSIYILYFSNEQMDNAEFLFHKILGNKEMADKALTNPNTTLSLNLSDMISIIIERLCPKSSSLQAQVEKIIFKLGKLICILSSDRLLKSSDLAKSLRAKLEQFDCFPQTLQEIFCQIKFTPCKTELIMSYPKQIKDRDAVVWLAKSMGFDRKEIDKTLKDIFPQNESASSKNNQNNETNNNCNNQESSSQLLISCYSPEPAISVADTSNIVSYQPGNLLLFKSTVIVDKNLWDTTETKLSTAAYANVVTSSVVSTVKNKMLLFNPTLNRLQHSNIFSVEGGEDPFNSNASWSNNL